MSSNQTKILTKDEILKADDLKRELVDIPEWGGSVYVKMLTGAERDDLEASVMLGSGKRNYVNLRAKMVVLSTVDAEGNRLFTIQDIKAIGGKAVAALDRIFTVAQRLSKMTPKDINDLAKKSNPAQADDSISN
jgi:hypothetical protein